MPLTRVPSSLLNDAFPIRWIGTKNNRENELVVSERDIKYLYLQKENGSNKLFVLENITNNEPVWTEVSGSIGGDASEIGSIIDDKIEEALDISKLSPITKDEMKGTSIVLGQDSTGNPVKISMSQVKEYVDSPVDNNWCGWHPTVEQLKSEIASGNFTEQNGSFAIIGSTDTIWVYDSDTGEWKDTGNTNAVPSTISVTGGDGLTGGGYLNQSQVISVDFGVGEKQVCRGNDPRLLPGANIIGVGTEEQRNNLSDSILDASAVNKFYIQTTGSGESRYGELFQLTKAAPDPEWLRIGAKQEVPEKSQIEKGIVVTASQTEFTLTSGAYNTNDYILLVFLSGVLQLQEAFGVTANANNTTTITLAKPVGTDVTCDVVIIPKQQ